jgi:hypothetical protein
MVEMGFGSACKAPQPGQQKTRRMGGFRLLTNPVDFGGVFVIRRMALSFRRWEGVGGKGCRLRRAVEMALS